jgi:hypothetical protein
MSTQKTAYVHGIMTKLAEHNVDPVDFVNHAASSGHPALMKMAQLVVESAQQTKTAGRMQAMMDLPQNVKALRNMQPAMDGAFEVIGDPAEAHLRKQIMQGAQGAAGVGAAGAGAVGLGYGMTDADTWQNDLRNASNQYLGTDFDTESKLRALYNQARG